jgi:hypothetical protein
MPYTWARERVRGQAGKGVALSAWDYPIMSDRECGASRAPGRNCVDLRDRAGCRPCGDDLVCSYCGKPFELPVSMGPRRLKCAGDDLDGD